MTLSKCDKEEMGTEIKIAVEKRPTTAVALCDGCGDGLGFLFWVLVVRRVAIFYYVE